MYYKNPYQFYEEPLTRDDDHHHDHHDHDHDHDHDHHDHDCDDDMYKQRLRLMYPVIYYRMYPYVMYLADMHEVKHGKYMLPCEDDMKKMCMEICDKSMREDMDYKDSDEDMSRQPYGRNYMHDFARIFLINEFYRRRRRRRRHYYDHHDYYDRDYDYNNDYSYDDNNY